MNSKLLDKLETDLFILNKDLLILAGTIFGSSIALATGREINNLFIFGEFFLFLSIVAGLIILLTNIKAKEWDYAFSSKNSLESFLITSKQKIDKFELETIEDLIARYKKLIQSNQCGILYRLLKTISIEKWPVIFNLMFLVGVLLILASLIPKTMSQSIFRSLEYISLETLHNMPIYGLPIKIDTTNLLINLDFWSAVSGFIGTIMLFFFGLPAKIDPNGHIHLILEQTDKQEAKKYKLFQKLSYLALGLIALSFLLQIIQLVTTT